MWPLLIQQYVKYPITYQPFLPYRKESPTSLATKVEQLESMLKMLQYDLKKVQQ